MRNNLPKKIFIFVLLFAACTTAPSDGEIQTGLAKTSAVIPAATEILLPPATPTPAPTTTPEIGTFKNPVPIGVGYTFPGLGTLTVVRSSWQPGQWGYAVAEISFRCELPRDQECNTTSFGFFLIALGGSGNEYPQGFDSSIPQPHFGSFIFPPVDSGDVEKGFAGFLITKDEYTLLMAVRQLEYGIFYYKLFN
jgi:hypothetical protein